MPPWAAGTALIDDISAGNWQDPTTGRTAPKSPFERIEIAESLDGAERELLADVRMNGRLVVVCDPNTWEAMGQRVARNLGAPGKPVDHLILDAPHADFAEVERLAQATAGYDHLVAVGSGTLNDLCKYVTFKDGRSYAVFATSGAMNGYTSTTASMSLASGLKTSVPAHAARGVFVDLEVNAAAPGRFAAAGFGDSICRSVAQTDWWMSHRLLGTDYHHAPYSMLEHDEAEMMARSADIGAGSVAGLGYLHRVLTLSGLGVVFTGVSNHGSMGEHQISHYIDCFARERHPGTVHGEQVGLATLTMARIQAALLDSERPPTLRPTRVDPDDMVRRMGPGHRPAVRGRVSQEGARCRRGGEAEREAAGTVAGAARGMPRVSPWRRKCLTPNSSRPVAPTPPRRWACRRRSIARPCATRTKCETVSPSQISRATRGCSTSSPQPRPDTNAMRPLAEMPRATAAAVECVLTDIDDTLTTAGRLPAGAYASLERLEQAGIDVVAVTGRSAGWCDMIARLWPVRGVVGENGAFYFAYDRAEHRMHRAYVFDDATRAAHKAGLARVRERVLAEVPGCAIASDQFCREADLAVDFREDVAPLPVEAAQSIKAIFESEGGVAKVSSIHVNGWFGDYDKLTTSRRLLAERLGRDMDADEPRIVYCGDSPNDAPMFAFFSNGCGVANVRGFAGQMSAEPTWVASAAGGAGFVQIADHLLAGRVAP